MHAFHVNARHGTIGHAQWSSRNFPRRLEATTLRLPDLIGERERKGHLKTDQRRRETMGPRTNREVQGGRAVVVIKRLGECPGHGEGPQGRVNTTQRVRWMPRQPKTGGVTSLERYGIECQEAKSVERSSNQAMASLPCRAAQSRPSRYAVTAWALTELRLHGRKELRLIEGKKMAVLPSQMYSSLS
jgi:hypothetical protein